MVTLEDARTIAQSLAEKISPVSVILFGSVARTGKGSDLDILVVTEQEDMHREVSSCLRGYNRRFAIDYFVASVDRITRNFREGSPFLRLVQKEGRVLYMKNSMKEWIGLTLEDFRQAKYLFEGSFYRGACFAAQQAVEKAIKTELLKRGWDLEKIHNIRRLLSISEDYNLDIECDDDDIDFMDSIYRGRYPAEEGLLPLNTPTAEDASRAISTAEGVLKQLQLLEKNEQEK
ncbi:MAG: HEPN domain-containing protein [Deltaproteobacteria bacterium]|nr:HEPN domain-containing protein [Deltaproteobacteria bacterium]